MVTAMSPPTERTENRTGVSTKHTVRIFAAALFCVLTSLLVVLVTTSITLRYRAPSTAIKIWPWNGEARGSLAGRLVLNGDFSTARRLAMQAVRQVPGDAISLRALGTAQPPSETADQALPIMRLATRASRRDLLTNLWFIEYFVSKGDVANTIRYYDYSLKSSADSEQLLFPILAPAMASADIAAAVRTKLATRPVWTTSFLQYAFASGAADNQLIGVVLSMSRDPIGLSLDLKQQYAQRLAERGNFAGLERLARGLGRPPIEGTAILGKIGDLPPVDWRLLSAPGLSTFADPKAGFSFVANQNGMLAERILHLTPGAYVLSMTTRFDDGGGDTQLSWSMTCLPESRPLALEAARDSATVSVPAKECQYQKLSLSLTNQRLIDGGEVSGTVTEAHITRLH